MRKVVLGGMLIVALILSSLYIANSLLLHHVYDLGPQLTYQPQVTLNQNPSSMQVPNSSTNHRSAISNLVTADPQIAGVI